MSYSALLDKNEYVKPAFLASLGAHAVLLYLLLVGIHRGRPEVPNVIYSVTLESGSTRGGITQLPQTDKKTPVAPPKNISQKPQAEAAAKTKSTSTGKQESADEKAEVSLAEKKKEEPKKEEPKKEPPKKAEDKKKAGSPPAKSQAASKAAASSKPRPLTKAEIDRNYQQALQRYLGASTNAGGQGFGGDGRGGRGMGGGILKPPEWFLYKDKLETAVRQGWKWHQPSAELKASVQFSISPSGVISDLTVSRSSGNKYFDESVLRAVSKASPVPPAPPEFYNDFKFVEMDFLPE